MTRKVGITMDENLHQRAKSYASKTGRTLSGLIEISVKERLEGAENE